MIKCQLSNLFKLVSFNIFVIFIVSSNISAKEKNHIGLPIKSHQYENFDRKGNDKLYREGLSLFDKEEYVRALSKFYQLINQKTNYGKIDGVTLFIGASYEKIDMNNMALKFYSRIINDFKDSEVIPYVELALLRVAYKQSNGSVVKEQFKKLNKESISDSIKQHAAYYYGEQLVREEKFADAVNVFETISIEHPDYYFANHSAAIASYKIDSTNNEVVAYLDKVINCVSEDIAVREIINRSYLFLGYIYYEGLCSEERSMSKAVSALRKIPETSSYFEYALLGLGWTALKASQWIDCIASSQRLRSITESKLLESESMLLEGYCYLLDRKWGPAHNILESGLESIKEHNDGSSKSMEETFKLLFKSYQRYSNEIDSVLLVANDDKELVKKVSLKQKEEMNKYIGLQKMVDNFHNNKFFSRDKNKILQDIEYALAKTRKNTGVKSTIKTSMDEIGRISQKMLKIDTEEERLREELKELEETPMSSYVVGESSKIYDEELSFKDSFDVKKIDERTSSFKREDMLNAASHDDNEEFTFYQQYCNKFRIPRSMNWKIEERFILKCVDANNKTIPFAKIEIFKKKSVKSLFNARTMANGEVILFPYMDLGEDYDNIEDYYAKVNGEKGYVLEKGPESIILLKQNFERDLPETTSLQICFLLDATGSMKDEIDQLKDVIYSIHHRINSNPLKPKTSFSTVAYRDISDDYHYKKFDFTEDIDQFQINLEEIRAGGGGDYPEDMDKGLEVTMDQLSWKKDALKFVFLIGDAPPHLDYNRDKDYVWAMNKAREEGIMICPIGASGLRPIGEFIYRQIGILTNGEFIFLHYGETGESSGSATKADPGKVSHHTGSNYNVKKLDDIVVNIINTELGYITDEKLIVHEVPEVKAEEDFLDTRLENLLGQVFDKKYEEKLKDRKVVISPFTYKDSLFTDLSSYLWETSIEKVQKLSPLQVIERQKMEDILKEHSIDMMGLTEKNGDSDIGKLLSSDYIIFSSLKFLGAIRVCHMRLVDCKSGEVLSAARIKL